MDPSLLRKLDQVVEDVIDVLAEAGWHDEAAWYADLRRTLLSLEPGSPEFTELLVELEQSFLGLGTFTDVPLDLAQAAAGVSDLVDTHHQRLGLASCASGIIHEIKRSGG